MKVIKADHTRMIDLPGVGPCPRPVDIDERVTGFTSLKSLRIYRFEAGQRIEGESEGDEVFVVPVEGSVHMAISGPHPVEAELSAQGPHHALYMTPHHAYELAPQSETLVAYSRAAATGRYPTKVFDARNTLGEAEWLSYRLETVEAGQALSVGGKHETLVYMGRSSGEVAALQWGEMDTLAFAAGETATIAVTKPGVLLIVSA